MPHEVTTNEKSHPFQVFSSLILRNNEPFLDQIVMYKKKWILYDNQWWPAQWLDWKEAPKHFPKPNLHQKKSLGHWRSATSLIDYSFLNPSKTITSENYAQQINKMHSKLQYLQPALINKGPSSSPWQCPTAWSHNQHFKSWMNWATKFVALTCHIHLISIQLTTPSSSILTTFCREILPESARSRKCFPRVCWILKHWFLFYKNKQTYFSLAKMCWF